MRVAVLGCGAIGGVVASGLARASASAGGQGVDLVVINRNPRIASAIERQGLVLREGKGRTVTHPKVVDALPAALPAVAAAASPAASPAGAKPFDVIILANKADGMRAAALALLPYLAPDGVLVTTQNGLDALDLAAELGSDRVIPGAITWGSSMTQPGEYELTARGGWVIGALGGGERVARVASLLSTAFKVRVSSNITGVLWSKLIVVSSFTPLGAITGLRFGQLAGKRATRRLVLAIGREVLAVAQAKGVTLEPLSGGFNVPRLVSPGGYPAVIRDLMIRALGLKHRRTESSMLDSIRRGRKTEIDHLNGRIARLAAEAGVAAPLNLKIRRLVLDLEAGREVPGPALLARLA